MYDDPNTPYENKVLYYSGRPEIVAAVSELTGCPPTFSGAIISWRGCVAPNTARDLLSLGLGKDVLRLLSAITVEQGAVIHRVFNTSTQRTPGRRN